VTVAGTGGAPAGRRPPGATAPHAWVICLPAEAGAAVPADATAVQARGLLLDLRYGPGQPTWPRLSDGVSVADGLPVLLSQGGHAFAWWFGPPVPWDAMRAALGPSR
jgi:shikimate 5-dehydrogenase